MTDPGLSPAQRRELEWALHEEQARLERLDTMATAQIRRASQRLAEGVPGLAWAFPTLQQHYGSLPPQSWAGVAAMTGTGKTSFLMSLVLEWTKWSRRIYVLPFEVDATTMRLNMAAQASGLHPGRVAQGAWGELPMDAKERLAEQLAWQEGDGKALLRFSERSTASVTEMREEMDVAAAWGADVVILDHFHRLEGVENYRDTKAHAHNLTEMVKDYQVPILTALQINRNEKDFFAAHQPPHFQTIQGGEVIRQEAHVVLGLYRPLAQTVTRKDLALIRAGIGTLKIDSIVKPHCVGVHLMKHRYRGELVGHTLELGWDHGRVVDPITQAADALEGRYDL